VFLLSPLYLIARRVNAQSPIATLIGEAIITANVTTHEENAAWVYSMVGVMQACGRLADHPDFNLQIFKAGAIYWGRKTAKEHTISALPFTLTPSSLRLQILTQMDVWINTAGLHLQEVAGNSKIVQMIDETINDMNKDIDIFLKSLLIELRQN